MIPQVLYKQRFFSELLPTLLHGFREAAAQSKPAHLLAISYLLKHIPKSVLLSELPTVRHDFHRPRPERRNTLLVMPHDLGFGN
jgi:hypothetical protein